MKSVEEQLKIIRRGIAAIFPEEELILRLERSLREGLPLRVKFGIDPTASDIHLGHTVCLRKLKDFQALGHDALLIIGDFTALVGDPSGREKTRPQLTSEEVEANARTYLEQVSKILDTKRLKIVRNSDWFGNFKFRDVIELASKMTVARLLERDDFSNRFKSEVPISLHEFFYPLMQGYDSVMVRSDIELGGTEQTFNLLVGRNLQKESGMDGQIALTMPILVGTDGSERMSKSLGNYIGIAESPSNIYGKVMSIPDDLMRGYFELLTDVPREELRDLVSPTAHPMEAKKRLARELVSTYHTPEAAARAEEEFEKVFTRKELPDEIEPVYIPSSLVKDGKVWAVKLILTARMAPSGSEARRLIAQGGVTLDGEKISDPDASVEIRPGMVLKVGKRKFARLFLKEG